MLNEPDVIEAICKYLELNGYVIKQKIGPKQQGDDIIAEKKNGQKRVLYIEAKGETSSKDFTARYGKPFSNSQVKVHVAEAFYRCAEVISRGEDGDEIRIGIGLPYSRLHRNATKKIKTALDKLNIALFWVQQNEGVIFESNWILL